MLLLGGRPTLVPSFCGLLAGLLYQLNVCHVRRLLLPRSLCRFCHRTLGKLLGAPRGPTVRLPAGRAASALREVTGASPQALTAEPPSEAHVAQLAEMGFTREQALEALRATHNNVDRAVALLLG